MARVQPLKLYLLSQNVNTDYDTYDSCVVAAKDEAQARRIHPGMYGNRLWWVPDKDGLRSQAVRCWASPKEVSVVYIGDAVIGTKVGAICSSFNAG